MYELTAGEGVDVYDNAAVLRIPEEVDSRRSVAGSTAVSGRLLIDCMGNFSPIVRQVLGRPCLCRSGLGTEKRVAITALTRGGSRR